MAKKIKRYKLERDVDKIIHKPLEDWEIIDPKNTLDKLGITRKAFTTERLPDVLDPRYVDYKIEYELCKNDIVYFISNYVYISTLDAGFQLFKPREYQIEVIENILNYRNTATMTARQMGKTITVCAYILWLIVFHDTQKVDIVSYLESDAKKALGYIKLSYERLPLWLQKGVKIWNEKKIVLEDESTVSAKTEKSSRGGSLNFLYVDEFAFFKKPEEFWAGALPTLQEGSDTKLCITTTPKGMNYFHHVWTTAHEKNIKTAKIEYTRHPNRRTKEYKDKTINEVGIRIWRQEFECSFVGSSETLVDLTIFDPDGAKWEQNKPINEVNLSGSSTLRIYNKPVDGNTYILSSDISEGIGSNYSTITVFDTTTIPFKLVYSWRDNMVEPVKLAGFINDIGRMYNNALVVPEHNNAGQVTAWSLKEHYQYPNLFVSYRDLYSRRSEHRIVGVITNSVSRPIGCTIFKSCLESGLIDLRYDPIILSEIATFEKTGETFRAIKDCQDDMVMSCVIFSMILIVPTPYVNIPPDMFNVILDAVKVDNEKFEYITPDMADEYDYLFKMIGGENSINKVIAITSDKLYSNQKPHTTEEQVLKKFEQELKDRGITVVKSWF